MRLVLVLVVLCAFLAGCVVLAELPPPLERVVEVPGMSAKTIVTVGTALLVRDWAAWLEGHPEPWRSAVLLHEAEHAKRQTSGLATWLWRYGVEPGFAWEEEKVGWSVALAYLRGRGLTVDPAWIVETLRGYGPFPYGPIASDAELMAFAESSP